MEYLSESSPISNIKIEHTQIESILGHNLSISRGRSMPRSSQTRRCNPTPSDSFCMERSNTKTKKKSKQERLEEARARAIAWHYGKKYVADMASSTAPRTKSKTSSHGIQDVKESKETKYTVRTSGKKSYAIDSREDEDEDEFFDATDRSVYQQRPKRTSARRYSADEFIRSRSDNFYYDGRQQEQCCIKPVAKKKSKKERLAEARARARAWSEKRQSFGNTTRASIPVKNTTSSRGKACSVKEDEGHMETHEREFGPTGTPVKKKRSQKVPKREEYRYLTAEMDVEEMEVDEVWFDAEEVGEVVERAIRKRQSKAERRRIARERAALWAANRKSIG